MSKQQTAEPKVLACIDGAAFSEAVCDYALWMSQRIGAPLKFLHTIEPQPVPPVADMSGAIGLGSSEELLNELTEVEQRRSSLRIKKGKLMLEGARARAAGVPCALVTFGPSGDDMAALQPEALLASYADLTETVARLIG